MTAPLSSFSLSRLLDDMTGHLPSEGDRRRRDKRPEWLVELTECVADLFEPLRDVARVGFDCRPVNGRWHLDVFLGPTETVGGAQDGYQQVPSFKFDLRALFRCFDRIEACDWLAAPSGEAARDDEPALPPGFSQLQIEGDVQGSPLAITVSSLPPEEIGVGLKIYGDEPVAV